MEKRKKCISCNKPLIAFQGNYLHPDKPCNGIRDAIYIEGNSENDTLYFKFKELYGEPEIDDYDLLKVYEDKIDMYRKLADKYEDKLSNPIIKFIIYILQSIYYRRKKV